MGHSVADKDWASAALPTYSALRTGLPRCRNTMRGSHSAADGVLDRFFSFQNQVESRAKILEIAMAPARARYDKVSNILNTYFLHKAVPPGKREEAAALVRRIKEAAYWGRLHILHVGTAIKVDQHTLKVTGFEQRGACGCLRLRRIQTRPFAQSSP